MKGPVENRCILVVDDDRDIRETLTEIIEGEGFLAVGATNGQEALTYLRHALDLPALILLDVMMPVMNGGQFRKEQVKNPSWSGIPVVLMTATSLEQMVSKLDCQHLEGLPHLQKPIDLRTLLDVIALA